MDDFTNSVSAMLFIVSAQIIGGLRKNDDQASISLKTSGQIVGERLIPSAFWHFQPSSHFRIGTGWANIITGGSS